jgi:type I restriction enzyme R subunit
MTSNFDFARAAWPELAGDCARAESYGRSDPRTSVFYSRRALEQLIGTIYDLRALPAPYRDDLAALIGAPQFQQVAGPEVVMKATLVRRAGNDAVHRQRPIAAETALRVLEELFDLTLWTFFRFSTTPDATPMAAVFDRALVPPPAGAEPALGPEELQRLLARHEARDAAVAEAKAANDTLQAELEQLRAQVAAAQAAKTVSADTHDYSEARTRTRFIDADLREAGWEPDAPHVREFPVAGMPGSTAGTIPEPVEGSPRTIPGASTGAVTVPGTGPATGWVDYVLWGSNGLPLAVVEAKRTSKQAAIGQQQAKLYADCLEAMTGRRPVIYFSNGFQTWLWDDAAGYPPRKVSGYHTRDELELLVLRRTSRLPLAGRGVNPAIVERHYQHRAIRRVGEEFELRRRRALLVMATGSGKTRTVIALVDQLMKAGWVKRVLFLADRVALVNQAVGAFKTHLPSATTVNLVTEKVTDGRVYVSTYPTMTGLIDSRDDEGRRVFGPGFFDLVVIDEAHRSVYAKYRGIFEWFDALLVGLTATPKDEIDHNTYGLFELEDGVPTDAYPLDEAVAEGFLVPPRAVAVPLKFLTRGVAYRDLSEDEKDEWDAADWNDDGVVPDAVSANDLNSYLFNADTTDKVLEVLMTSGYKVAGADRLGKTIIFARNQQHAEFVKQRFDANYPWLGGHNARLVTHQVTYAQSLIDDFGTPEKQPDIAISVDMLDTGIDVPEVCNLVFFKPVYSATKFWQMIGRGTRLRPDLFGPGEDKTDFLVFDFCGNLEYFSAPDAGVEGSTQKPLSQRVFEARLALLAGLDEALPSGVTVVAGDGTTSERGLRNDVAQHLHRIVLGMNTDNFLVRGKREWVERWSSAGPWTQLSPDAAAEAAQHLAALPSAFVDDDEDAKRFDLMILTLQLAALEGDQPTLQRWRAKVQAIATNLLGKPGIPAVAAQLALLGQVEADEWWVDVTLPMLELARRRLRLLVRHVDKGEKRTVYSHFTDELGDAVPMTLPGASVGTNLERFRAKARDWLRGHRDHVALQKLRRNRQLTPADLDSLQAMLIDAGVGTRDDLARATTAAHGLGLFVRSLVGLDREAASEAFSGFLRDRTLSARQLDFLNLVIEHLTATGAMEAARLYESPFTDHAPTGPDFLFSDPDVDAMVVILDDIRDRAIARGGAFGTDGWQAAR